MAHNEMTQKQKMLAGELYEAWDDELVADRRKARLLFEQYNRSSFTEPEIRQELLSKLLGSLAGEATIEPTFKCDYGYNIHVGEAFYANFDLIILDVCEVRIGDNCLIGPRVSLLRSSRNKRHTIRHDRRRRSSKSPLEHPAQALRPKFSRSVTKSPCFTNMHELQRNPFPQKP